MSTAGNTQKLQQLFGLAAAQPFNAFSKRVFSRLHHCHTATNGVHTYRCNNADCNHLHYQYHPSFIGTVATGIVPTVVGLKKNSGWKILQQIFYLPVIIM